jgi:tryptophan synthase alpha chain
MTRLGDELARKKAAGQKIFVPYITAGDPSLEATERFVRALADAGADAIELGVPFSDPVADGPVNRRAAERALTKGTSLRAVLDLVARLSASGFATPIVIFTYLNPILRLGTERFAALAKEAGVSGALVVDLPPEEAVEHCAILEQAGIASVFLASPTTVLARRARIVNASTGFLYYVSRTGVTGARADISPTLAHELEPIRASTDKPVIVGFGISNAEQASAVAAMADGVIVGSAFVRIIEEEPREEIAEARIRALAGSISAAIRTL